MQLQLAEVMARRRLRETQPDAELVHRLRAAGDALRDTVRGGPGTDTADADEDLDDVLGVEAVS